MQPAAFLADHQFKPVCDASNFDVAFTKQRCELGGLPHLM